MALGGVLVYVHRKTYGTFGPAVLHGECTHFLHCQPSSFAALCLPGLATWRCKSWTRDA